MKTYTVSEYLTQTPEGSYELINGVLHEPPTPGFYHQKISGRLHSKLITFIDEHDLGTLLTAPMDVIFNDKLILQPDLLFITQRRKKIIKNDRIYGTPDMVVEIISPGSFYHDTIKKKEYYLQQGVREYWLVYPSEKKIEIFTLKKKKYCLHQTAHGKETIESWILPGLRINLEEVFI